MLAADEGIGFWEGFFLLLVFIPLVMLWAFTLIDLFRRRDLSGAMTVVWLLFVVLLPVIGVLVYFLARPVKPQDVDDIESYQHSREAAEAARAAEALEKLAARRDAGDLTPEEFAVQKAKLLGP